MHEMALCESLIGVIEAEARRQSFSKVRKIWIEVGPFSGAEPEAMKFCFDAVAHGTLADHAMFEIIAMPGAAYCLDCAESISISQRYDPCPMCGGHHLQITGGEELRIKELEVD